MRAARVNASIAAVLQQHLRKLQDCYDELTVSILLVSQLCQLGHIPRMVIMIFDRRSLLQQDFATEVSHLRTIAETVCGAEGLQNAVESVEQGQPVIQIATRERPSRGEFVELLGEQRQRDRGRGLDVILQPRRLCRDALAAGHQPERWTGQLTSDSLCLGCMVFVIFPILKT